MMLTLLALAGVTLLVSGIVLLLSVIYSPDGHEDADGFHLTNSPSIRTQNVQGKGVKIGPRALVQFSSPAINI